MSTILCRYSGIEFSVPYFNIHLSSSETEHPIFHLPPDRLLRTARHWFMPESAYSEIETYLLYIAVFKATRLVRFSVPCAANENTLAICSAHMESAVRMLETIQQEGYERLSEVMYLPNFIISPDTKYLEQTPDWIVTWRNAIADYKDAYKTATLLQRLEHQEMLLERHIKDASKDVTTYAPKLANWAADAGNFPLCPAGLDSNILGGRNMTLRDYWKHIIVACCKLENIWEIPNADILELAEHCDEHIPTGSIFSHTLHALLKAGLDRRNSFFNLGDADASTSGAAFRILDATASVEDANKLAMIDSAPLTEPRESAYPNKIAYLKAKMNYRMACEYRANLAAETTAQTAKEST